MNTVDIYANKILDELSGSLTINNHFRNWKMRIMMQPYFGKVKGGDTIKIRVPRRYRETNERSR